jgi:N-acetylneuraminate synthase
MKLFTIAEIGINHNGDIDLAKKLIDVACENKLNAVKFQKRTIEKVYSKEILDQKRESPWGDTQRDQKNGLEFGQNEYEIINEYCNNRNIHWFASAWDEESVDFLNQFKSKYNKIASPMITDLSFMEKVSKEKKHTFISTGMTNLKNIEDAVQIFKKNNCSFELMHCISTYPMKPENANLETINGLRELFNCDVGYSGHESGIAVSLAAVVMGITSLERHITLDRSMYGSDQAASLEPRGVRELIGSINIIENAIGKNMTGHFFDEERPIADKLRAHIRT